MPEGELIDQLRSEGYSRIYIWEDVPNARYPDHTHRIETSHVILSGEMTLTMDGRSQTYHVGGRCDVSAGAVHSAIMGTRGCRYIIGER